ncbi:MAG: serine/threonine-protein phosphatase [Cytophagales bacterium]|nr:MAG: serine/threonine-protein phosphatase [Cytophagales bacterium]TAF62065.1 MAG: serine/threonine-protein phosphatase [Cytophagales bacterium]
MNSPQKYKVASITDKGLVREINEDNLLLGKHLNSGFWSLSRDEEVELMSDEGLVLLVADGMGGTNAGEVASKTACEVVKNLFGRIAPINLADQEREFILKKVLLESHEQILKLAHQRVSYNGMGTTAVVAWICDTEAHIVWSGDSRAYLLKPTGELVLLTQDHSVVWEMVRKGEITAEESQHHPSSNVITQSLGDTENPPQPDYVKHKMLPGERLLLCSDGLNSMLSDSIIQKLGTAIDANTPYRLCDKLVKAANLAGGSDNTTVLVVELAENINNRSKDSSRTSYKSYWWLGLLLVVLLGFGLWFFKDQLFPKKNQEAQDMPYVPLTIPELPVVDSSRQNTNKQEPVTPTIKIPQQAAIFKDVQATRASVQAQLSKLQDNPNLNITQKRQVSDIQEAYAANTLAYDKFLSTLASDSLNAIQRIKIENYKALLVKYNQDLTKIAK